MDKKEEKQPKKGYGLRSPDKVIEQRINEAIILISSRPNIRRGQIHAFFRERWFDINKKPADWRTIDRLVSRARLELIERLKRPKEDFQCDVLAKYEKLLQSDKEGIQLAALSGIRDLLGLDAPRRIAVGNDTESTNSEFIVRVTEGELPKPKK